MRTLKEFISTKKVEEPEIVFESQEPQILNVEDSPLLIESGKAGQNEPLDPPAVLIMKRKSIRQFPNGQRVALYYVDKINKYVTVPYNEMQWSVSVKEDIIQTLTSIVEENDWKDITHSDNKTSAVSPFIAKTILEAYNKLNSENKSKVTEMLNNSQKEFKEFYNFAFQNKK